MRFPSLLQLTLYLAFGTISSLSPVREAQADTPRRIYTIETIPNPKTTRSYEYVSNPDDIMSSSTVVEIDSLLKDLETTTTCQVAVVVVNSIGETEPKSFAINLFNYWGIGDREKDNGLLILMVMDQHSIEFETGKGMEGILTDVTCKHIQEQYMIPYAKAGNFDAALFAGVKAVVMQIKEPGNTEEVYAENSSAFESQSWWQRSTGNVTLIVLGGLYILLLVLALPRFRKKNKPEYVLKYRSLNYIVPKTLLLNLALPATWIWIQMEFDPPITNGELIIAIYVFIALLFLEARLRLDSYIEKFYGDDRHAKHLALTKSRNDWLVAPVFFPIPFLFYSLWKKNKLKKLRETPYACEKCGYEMIRLDEQSDDYYLSTSQVTEEKIKSVDYDVWQCKNCSNQKLLSYVNLYSKYTECSACKSKSRYFKESRTIIAPSYSNEGKGEKVFDCMNCHTKTTEYYVMAKLHQSTSGSSYSGSSSGSSGSSGGGSSWGGGSSGGGGAGSKW